MQLNPYESPQSAAEDGSHVIHPRRAPRKLLDWAIGLGVGTMLVPILVSPAILILVYLPGSIPQLAAHGVYLLSLVILLSVLILPGIRKLTLQENGIRLHRTLGQPRFVPWSQVLSWRETSVRQAVALQFEPFRTCPQCLSFHQWYCIEYEGGMFFFPPADISSFLGLMERYASAEARANSAISLEAIPDNRPATRVHPP